MTHPISKKDTKGFTLIELIVVIIILGVLAMLISGNFINSLQKGRDARRKNDLAQVQRALELYYEDVKAYPSATPPFGASFCQGYPCPTTSKVYMRRTPNDPNSGYNYNYVVDPNGQYYYLFSCVENYWNDKGFNVSNGGFNSPLGGIPDCGGCGVCKYYASSPNAVPLTPRPTLVP